MKARGDCGVMVNKKEMKLMESAPKCTEGSKQGRHFPGKGEPGVEKESAKSASPIFTLSTSRNHKQIQIWRGNLNHRRTEKASDSSLFFGQPFY